MTCDLKHSNASNSHRFNLIFSFFDYSLLPLHLCPRTHKWELSVLSLAFRFTIIPNLQFLVEFKLIEISNFKSLTLSRSIISTLEMLIQLNIMQGFFSLTLLIIPHVS